MMPVVGGAFKMGSAEDDENRGDEELLERRKGLRFLDGKA